MRPSGLPPRRTTGPGQPSSSTALVPTAVGAPLAGAGGSYSPGAAAAVGGGFSGNALAAQATLIRIASACEKSAASLDIIRGQFGTALTQLARIAGKNRHPDSKELLAKEEGGGFGKLSQFVTGFTAVWNALTTLPERIRGALDTLTKSNSTGERMKRQAGELYQERLGQPMLPAAAMKAAMDLTLADQMRNPSLRMARADIDLQGKQVAPALSGFHEFMGKGGAAALLALENPLRAIGLMGAALKNGVPEDSNAAGMGAQTRGPGGQGGGTFHGLPVGKVGGMLRQGLPGQKEPAGLAGMRNDAWNAETDWLRRQNEKRVVEDEQRAWMERQKAAAATLPAARPAAPAAQAAAQVAPGPNPLAQAAPAPAGPAGADSWSAQFVRNLELLTRSEMHHAAQRFAGPATVSNLSDVKRQAQLRVLNTDPIEAKRFEMSQENIQLLKELIQAVREGTDQDRRKRGPIGR